MEVLKDFLLYSDVKGLKVTVLFEKPKLPVGESNPGLPLPGGDTVHYTNEECYDANFLARERKWQFFNL